MSEYKNATCRGAYTLGTACGHCERCTEELNRLNSHYKTTTLEAWDKWYSTLPISLKLKLSLHEFKCLGDCFKKAFEISNN